MRTHCFPRACAGLFAAIIGAATVSAEQAGSTRPQEQTTYQTKGIVLDTRELADWARASYWEQRIGGNFQNNCRPSHPDRHGRARRRAGDGVASQTCDDHHQCRNKGHSDYSQTANETAIEGPRLSNHLHPAHKRERRRTASKSVSLQKGWRQRLSQRQLPRLPFRDCPRPIPTQDFRRILRDTGLHILTR